MQHTRLLHPWDIPGKSTLQRRSKILFYVSLKEGIHIAGLCPKPALLFPGFSPVSAFPLPFLTSKCLNLLPGTRRRGHRKTSVPRIPQGPACFQGYERAVSRAPLVWDCTTFWRNNDTIFTLCFLHFSGYKAVVYLTSAPVVILQMYSSQHCNFSLCVSTSLLVAQLCLTLCNPMDCSLSGSSALGILQARILEWVAISYSS